MISRYDEWHPITFLSKEYYRFGNDILCLERDTKKGNSHNWIGVSSVLWLLVGIVPLFAQSQRTERVKPPYPSIRLSRQLHNEEAIQALGDRLPAVASWHGKTADEMKSLLRRDRDLWVSQTGRLMYTCASDLPSEADESATTGVTRDHIASFPLDQTFKLHSLPASKKTIYLDFNGGTISGTAWNSSFTGGADIIAAPFDLDGDPGTFSTTELQRIQNIWKRVAEDYAPFDVDVTTEEPAADALARSSNKDDVFGNRVMITPTNFYPNAGGVSYVGAFDDVGDYYKISWAFSNKLANSEKYIAEACSHENGHSVGLHHEGTTSGTTYYQGQGDWAPIMGNSYYKNVTQWARGEYTGANNTEDQLLVMQNYGLAYFTDDHGNTANTATQMAIGISLSETGFIERNTDADVFKFLAGAGAVSVSISPSPLGPDLKMLAELHDSSWNLLASSSNGDLSASINATLQAGVYYLKISGVGSGDPASTGYSDYASLGQFVITGTVADPGTTTMPPSGQLIRADFDGNGQADLVWRNTSTGENYIWYMDGVMPIGGSSLPRVSDQSWQIVGVADFDKDGTMDVLWRNSSTGENHVWYLDGTTVLAGAPLPRVSDQNWKVVGVEDFDKNGNVDILWRNISTGDNCVWYLDGTTVLAGAPLPRVSDQSWKVVGVADFDKNGNVDILWRNISTGDSCVWYLDGTTVLTGAPLPRVSDQDWKIVGVADFDKNGNVDILWRNTSTGDNYVWYLDGTTVLTGASLPRVSDQTWTIVP